MKPGRKRMVTLLAVCAAVVAITLCAFYRWRTKNDSGLQGIAKDVDQASSSSAPASGPEARALERFFGELDRAIETASKKHTEDSKDWWVDVGYDGNELFWKHILSGTDAEAKLIAATKSFGARGPWRDMLLLISQPSILLAQKHEQPGCGISEDVDEITDIRRRYVRYQNVACKAQVTMFLQDRRLLARYYRALIWGGTLFFERENFHATALKAKAAAVSRGLTHETSADFWWYARDFVILAYATGRESDLTGVAATRPQLLKAAREWVHWFNQNAGRLRPNKNRPIWETHILGLLTPDPGPLQRPPSPFRDWNTTGRSVPSRITFEFVNHSCVGWRLGPELERARSAPSTAPASERGDSRNP